MHTAAFVDLVTNNLTGKNPANTDYECLFFGFSEPYVYDGCRHRCWQAALVRAGLGAMATARKFNYYFFVSATDERSGAHINMVESETAVSPLVIPGLCEGDEAVIGASGLVIVRVQGMLLHGVQ